MSIDFSFI
ncbi:hypothetical protein CGLO_00938 [Colletotrichum gloeosporioides Cg-14]|uniref:Uncharacterized protein n=1 Tax=Colletotrichum gloeosporioides (strain Cg-14) TaxID=1237896 RepID=T0KT95_COLGC|nr:hypothetical protein CGLO_00938 [Colletotrichum gloeosporioides Cg-14]